jgi:hypothetical protein
LRAAPGYDDDSFGDGNPKLPAAIIWVFAENSFSYTNPFGYLVRLFRPKECAMPILDSLIGPLVSIIDKVIPDREARDKAKLELIKLQGSQEMEVLQTRMSAIIAEANSQDPWTSRARPSFLYVMYALILFAIPMGLISAFSPGTAKGIADGMAAYLAALPDALYGVFATGYLGYTVARQWGKAVGSDK